MSKVAKILKNKTEKQRGGVLLYSKKPNEKDTYSISSLKAYKICLSVLLPNLGRLIIKQTVLICRIIHEFINYETQRKVKKYKVSNYT